MPASEVGGIPLIRVGSSGFPLISVLHRLGPHLLQEPTAIKQHSEPASQGASRATMIGRRYSDSDGTVKPARSRARRSGEHDGPCDAIYENGGMTAAMA